MSLDVLAFETPNLRWARLSDAIASALKIHADQTRKGTDTPYISRLLGVSSLVLEHGGDEDQAIAGLLHDVVEDHGAHQLAVGARDTGRLDGVPRGQAAQRPRDLHRPAHPRQRGDRRRHGRSSWDALVSPVPVRNVKLADAEPAGQ
jgi:hypothetical protein